MKCISINYKTASADIRSKFAFGKEEQKDIISELKDSGIEQCVVLATCGRTEIYFCGADFAVINILAQRGGVSDIKKYTNCYYGGKAVEHLFRVASGMASQVLGEDEILRQTKEAYRQAAECGAAGYEFHKCFQGAIACAKRIKTDTELSKTSVSTATIAANEAARFGKKALVIGASGHIGGIVVKDLLSHKMTVAATFRKNSPVISGVEAVAYADRYSAVSAADCIISATSSPHYTVTLSNLKKHNISGKKLFIDLAVPADIDENIDGEEGFSRIGIDDISMLAKSNNEAKLSSAERAGIIIKSETEKLKKDLIFHKFSVALGAERLRSDPERLLYRLKSELNYDQLKAVLGVIYGTE